jgi:hypothetical protein
MEKLTSDSVLGRLSTLLALARLTSGLVLLGLETTLLEGVAALLLAVTLALALVLSLLLTGTGLLLTVSSTSISTVTGIGLSSTTVTSIRLSSITVTSTSVRLGSVVTTSRSTTAGRSTTLGDGHVGRSAAEVTLSGEDLVVVGTELHAVLLPSLEVSTNIDATGGSVILADGPVLLKGLSTVDGGSVGTGLGEDVVGAAIDLDSSLLLGSSGRIVVTELLDDVVLDQRVSGPSVDGEVAVAVGLVLSLVRDGSGDVSINS